MPIVYSRVGAPLRRPANLRGVLAHYSSNPEDLVVKVKDDNTRGGFAVTFFWPRCGDHCETHWHDWRVLLDWLKARRSWSIERVTFDAPLYDRIESDMTNVGISDSERIRNFRHNCAPLTRHAYQS